MDDLFLNKQGKDFRDRVLKAMDEYARACCKASLEKAKDNIEIRVYKSGQVEIDRSSVTDESNIVLV